MGKPVGCGQAPGGEGRRRQRQGRGALPVAAAPPPQHLFPAAAVCMTRAVSTPFPTTTLTHNASPCRPPFLETLAGWLTKPSPYHHHPAPGRCQPRADIPTVWSLQPSLIALLPSPKHRPRTRKLRSLQPHLRLPTRPQPPPRPHGRPFVAPTLTRPHAPQLSTCTTRIVVPQGAIAAKQPRAVAADLPHPWPDLMVKPLGHHPRTHSTFTFPSVRLPYASIALGRQDTRQPCSS